MTEFAPEEVKKSKRIFKSATPKGTLDWYVKWASSVLILVALTFRSAGTEYHLLDMIFGWLGMGGWLIVGILWRDRAVIILNAVSLALLTVGLLKAL